MDNGPMQVEKLEQIAAVIVTAGLVAGNLVLFSPWRRGQDPRERGHDRSEAPIERWAVTTANKGQETQAVLSAQL